VVYCDFGGGLTSGRFEQFYALASEKQQRIITAALEEFAAQGFARASTNTIVKAAGIGKGMLFYYFGNKEELFDFLCEYALEAPERFLSRLNFDSGDFLERYQALAAQKQELFEQEPALMRFYESLYRDNAHTEKFAARLKSLRELMHNKLYDGLNYNLLREDLAPEQTIEYMKWLLERYEQEVLNQYKGSTMENTPVQWQLYYDFLANLRKLFYR